MKDHEIREAVNALTDDVKKFKDAQCLRNVISRHVLKIVDRMKLQRIKPCPFCGHDLNTQDELDTIYPVGHSFDTPVYQIVCQTSSGGCDASILGDSKEDCIRRWNRRT